jgi:hypothetical protein
MHPFSHYITVAYCLIRHRDNFTFGYAIHAVDLNAEQQRPFEWYVVSALTQHSGGLPSSGTAPPSTARVEISQASYVGTLRYYFVSLQ